MFDHCLYFNTSALARRLDREWSEAFARFGLTPAQGFMLRAVLDRPGMAQSQLAEEMSIARPTATRALDGLERLGLIERQSSERDGCSRRHSPSALRPVSRSPASPAAAASVRHAVPKYGRSNADNTS